MAATAPGTLLIAGSTFALRELLARVRALTRRHLDNRAAVPRLGEVELDTSARTVHVRGHEVTFTAKEFGIL